MDFLKKLYNSFILVSILEIAVGIFLFLKPDIIQTTISYVIGGVLIASGVLNLISYIKGEPDYGKVFKAVILSASGVFIIVRPDFIFNIIATIFGLYLLIDGISGLKASSLMKTYEDNNKWIPSFVIALLTVILGLIIIFNPLAASGIPFQIFGIALIISGVLNIYNGGVTKKYLKKLKKQIEQKEYIDIE